MKSTTLKQTRATKETELANLRTEIGDKTATHEQRTKLSGLLDEVDTLTKDIELELRLEKNAAEAATRQAQADGLAERTEADPEGKKPKGKQGGEARARMDLMRRASISDAIARHISGKPLEGAEKEMADEGNAELRSFNKSADGVAVPSFFFAEQRALSVGSAPSAGNTVNVEESGLIEFLYPQTVLNQLGVTNMTGMSSNFDLIRQNGGAAAEWEGETDLNAETDPTYERIPMRPKRLGAFTTFSKQLLIQSSLAVENEVRRNLSSAIGIALETAALNGSGTGDVPLGLLNQADINTVDIDVNGGALTREHLLMLEQVLSESNYSGNFRFLMTAALRRYLKELKTDAGSGRFVWNDNNDVIGYNATISNLMPRDLAKGTGTDLHAAILGDFSQLYVAQWGGLDIVVDQYTQAKNAQVNVIANSWWDIACRQPKGFAVIKDADPNA